MDSSVVSKGVRNNFMPKSRRSVHTIIPPLKISHFIVSFFLNSITHCLDATNIRRLNYNFMLEIVTESFVGLLHHPFWLQLVLARLGHLFSTFEITSLAKDH